MSETSKLAPFSTLNHPFYVGSLPIFGFKLGASTLKKKNTPHIPSYHSSYHSSKFKDMSVESAENNIKGIPTHGGRYIQYNIYGNLFEVSRKYVPPIRPVGRGAYGIVW